MYNTFSSHLLPLFGQTDSFKSRVFLTKYFFQYSVQLWASVFHVSRIDASEILKSLCQSPALFQNFLFMFNWKIKLQNNVYKSLRFFFLLLDLKRLYLWQKGIFYTLPLPLQRTGDELHDKFKFIGALLLLPL